MGEVSVHLDNISLQKLQSVKPTHKDPVYFGEAKPPSSLSLRDQLLAKKTTSPDCSMDDLLNFTDEQIRSFSGEDYEFFLEAGMYTDQPEVLFAKHSDVLADRFASDPKKYHDTHWDLAHSITEQTRHALWIITGNPDVTVSPQVLEKFYQHIESDNRFVRIQATEYVADLIRLDYRNQKIGGKYLDLLARYDSDTIAKLSHPKTPEEWETGRWLVEEAWAEWPSRLPEIMIASLKQADDGVMRPVFGLFANRIGLTESRQILRRYASENADFQTRMRHIEQVLKFGKRPGQTLEDLYVKILPEFQEYKPNKDLLQYEEQLLRREFKKTPTILDIGHGPSARHLRVLQEMGKKVFGFDLVREHVLAAKKISPKLDIAVADWHHMPYGNGTVDGIICLGRSIGHNTTIDDYIAMLSEMRRVMGISHDPHIKKRAIIDTPSLMQGDYKREINKVDTNANRMNILYREPGFIHDSPGNAESFDRLFLTPSQMTAIARFSGFKATQIGSCAYPAAEGKTNTNLYWKLEPTDESLDFEKRIDLIHKARLGSPPIEILWL